MGINVDIGTAPIVPPVVDPGASLIAGDDSDAAVAASAMVRGYCGWHIATSITSAVKVPLTGNVLFVPTLLMTDLQSVTEVAPVDDPDYEVATLSVADWFDDGRILLDPWQSWPSRLTSVLVTFVHGYDTVPADVSAAVKSFSARQQLPSVTSGLQSFRQGETSWTNTPLAAAASYLPVEMWTFDRYRLPKIA